MGMVFNNLLKQDVNSIIVWVLKENIFAIFMAKKWAGKWKIVYRLIFFFK